MTLLTVALVCLMIAITWIAMARDMDLDTGGGDSIAGYFAYIKRGADDFAYVWLVWMLVCLLVVCLGAYFGNSGFFAEAAQLVNAVNYVFVVPMLLVAYLFLLRSIAAFPLRSGGSAIRNRAFKHLRYAIIFLATALIVHSAIQSELEVPSPSSPWVTSGCLCKTKLDCDLSIPGVLFYFVRGIDTCLALGLTTAIALAFHRRRRRFFEPELVAHDFLRIGPSRHLSSLGAALLLVASLGSVVTFLHGTALFLQVYNEIGIAKKASANVPSNVIVDLFIRSTWIVWLFITLASSTLCVATVVWLRAVVFRRINRLHEKALQDLDAHFESAMESDASASPDPLSLVKLRLELEAKVAERFGTAQTWPLPMGAGLAFLGAAVLQLGNLLLGLWSLLRASPATA